MAMAHRCQMTVRVFEGGIPELLKLADSLLAKMLVESTLEVEMTDHMGHNKSGAVSNNSVTNAVSEDVKAWQARPLDALYPICYLARIHVKVRDTGAVRNKRP